MIREAENKDIEEILGLIHAFCAEGLADHHITFDDDSLRKTIKLFIESQIFLVIDDGGICGCIAGVVSPSIFNYNEIIVEERIWYVKESCRGGSAALRLLKEFENVSRNLGASSILMVHLSNVMPNKVRKIYELNGYHDVETHYIKKLGG